MNKKDKLINVFGCFRCLKLAGDLREKYITETKQGYEICPICRADLDYFWLNLTQMKFQETRPVTLKRADELAYRIDGKELCI
ncbi:MAG: hypothetical protein Q7R95_06165 [bacterium]|nr:hypothetical protein [bacterium]